ncbi:Acyl-CoA N-acyltransferase with RING/FYVE/PHD-type zinc finger domain-containing protein [Perilla frutescens var. hirtella]|nr:Acyl-CoA N-acyltransferase with RING/FYVE/PHD-type zinc finger domain-containing protein [Perilla frutescens var. hirtella]KAH6806044.1 Acyl-CoA N-acyltransferase with RING/FYVE/PHD-type zinc finger domain-containing protein [Perilla frutescens var. frutescens]
MKVELGLDIECQSELSKPEPGTGSGDPNRPESNGSGWMDHCYVPRVRPSEANGFAVYTRNKRLKSRSVDRTGFAVKIEGDSAVSVKVEEADSLNGEFVVNGDDAVNVCEAEGDLGTSGFGGGESEGEMMEIEVKEEPVPLAVVRTEGRRRFRRSVLADSDTENGISGNLRDTVILEADGLLSEELALMSSTNTRKMEMKMSKKILIKGRPATVRELFETGLLEGYPVFYNGGKRGFPLRGTIKDAGILCSCIFCKGVRVVPPCQFEIHACKSYRRASQYICLENGKSLLDVVKECRNSSVKTLEETIQNFIGPMPVKESVICRNCSGSFLATSAGKVELLCDSCMIILNSDFDAESVKSRPLEPLLGLSVSESVEVHSTPQKRGCRGRKKRKHLELKTYTKSPGKSLLHGATRKKGQLKITKMLSQPASALKPPGNAVVMYSKSSSDPTSNGSTSSHGLLKNRTTRKIPKKLSNTTPLSKSSKSASPPHSGNSKSSSKKITKKDQRMHKLVFENGGLPDGTEVAYYSNGKKLRDGYKMGSGIICRCCSTLVSPSQFEAHAGWASRRKPYMYIYTSNGVSLHEFAVSLLKGRKCSSKDNDDLCIICADGGKLVLCDGCPRAFHKECASLMSIPRGKWYCTYCQNMFQREKFVEWNANAVAAGRVSGIDPIEQITNRCIRTVKNPEEAEVIACVICRGYDFSKSGFGPRTVILCDQCEKEYHVGCLKKCKLADLKELPKGKWFCSGNCKWIYSALHNLLNSGAEKLPDSTLDIIRKKQTDKSSDSDTDLDVRWRLLNGKIASRETRVLLSQAVAIFHDCFDPIVDSETGRDFIPSLVYGRNIRGQDFSGMYCAILTVNSTVVSAGILRIFGEEIAELPLVATRIGHQGKGYFQLLHSCIEKLLAFLNVKSFVLPATDEAKSIWTEKFGFNKMPEQQLLNYRKICWQMIGFKGTSMLEKPVPKCRIINQDEADPDDFPLQ